PSFSIGAAALGKLEGSKNSSSALKVNALCVCCAYLLLGLLIDTRLLALSILLANQRCQATLRFSATLTSARSNPQQLKNPSKRSSPLQFPTAQIEPSPDGSLPTKKNVCSIKNRRTTNTTHAGRSRS